MSVEDGSAGVGDVVIQVPAERLPVGYREEAPGTSPGVEVRSLPDLLGGRRDGARRIVGAQRTKNAAPQRRGLSPSRSWRLSRPRNTGSMSASDECRPRRRPCGRS